MLNFEKKGDKNLEIGIQEKMEGSNCGREGGKEESLGCLIKNKQLCNKSDICLYCADLFGLYSAIVGLVP